MCAPILRVLLWRVTAALILLGPAVAAAQSPPGSRPADLTDLNLQQLISAEVVSAASLYEQRLSNAPASVTVITAEQIRAYGYRTLTDAIRGAAGFFTTYDRNYEYIGVRGFGRFGSYNGRILLLVDGHRINDNIYDSAGIGSDFIADVDLIDRIEIVRGPSSSIYGTNALFAVINVVMRHAADIAGLRVSGAGASYGTGTTRVSYGRTFGTGEVVASASMYRSGGQALFFPGLGGPASSADPTGADRDSAGSQFLHLSAGNFTVEAAHISREKHVPTGAFGTAIDDPRNRTIDDRGYFEGRYERPTAGGTRMVARLFYDEANYRGTYVYDAAASEDPPSILDDSGDGRWMGAELQGMRKIGAAHHLTTGTVFRFNLRQDQRNESDGIVHLDERRSSAFWAAYVQDEFRLRPNLLLNAGVRHDRYATFGGTTNPRVALIYSPDDRTTIKLLYGRAFRAPNAYELYYQDGGLSQKPALSLRPETIRTYEAVVERQLDRYTQAGVSLYDYRIRALIGDTIDPRDGLIVFQNQATVQSQGAEFTIRGRWPGGWAAGASHAVQEGIDEESRQLLATAPHHLSHANATVPLPWMHWFAGVDLLRIGARRTLSNDALPPSLVTNVTAHRTWGEHLDVEVSAYNLFDARYSDPAGEEHRQAAIPQNGRNWRVKLRWTF